jgi:TPR repeat protein
MSLTTGMKRKLEEAMLGVEEKFLEARNNTAMLAYNAAQVYELTGEQERYRMWLTRAVALGNSHAAFKLGKLNYSGKNVPQDFEKAKRLFYFSAEKGHPAAQCLVALYEYRTDMPKALEFVEKARQQGYAGVVKAMQIINEGKPAEA